MQLCGLFTWKNVCALGYTALESYLSVNDLIDVGLICVDPTSDQDTIDLAYRISQKYPKVRVCEFEWPKLSPDGSAIGVASNYALDKAREYFGDCWVVNVQGDEVWSEKLVQATRGLWQTVSGTGLESMRFKVLHTEHNAQRFQGGDEWDGKKEGELWRWQKGAGYNMAIKACRPHKDIIFSHDGWSFDNCQQILHVTASDTWPIMHLHDFHRDHLIALRRNAADNLWTDRVKFGNYKQTADDIESTEDKWSRYDLWTRTTSPFDELLPKVVKPCLGRTKYQVNWSLLDD